MKEPFDRLQARGHWENLLEDGGDITDEEKWFKDALSVFKQRALAHMNLLVQEVLKARAVAVEQMVSNVQIVVATMDAWCKYRAGCVRGLQGNILDGLELNLALIDEYEAFDIVQVQAACGCGLRSFETVVFLGDEHQRLEGFKHNPALVRHPWVGDARDRTAGLAQSENYSYARLRSLHPSKHARARSQDRGLSPV